MTITHKQFADLYRETQVYNDRDAYVSDLALSAILWADPDDPGTAPELTDDLLAALGNIWDVAHMTVKEIRAVTGLSQRAFAQRFCIPLRTAQSWEAPGPNHRDCPPYVRLLLADACGMIKIHRS